MRTVTYDIKYTLLLYGYPWFVGTLTGSIIIMRVELSVWPSSVSQQPTRFEVRIYI